MNDKDFDPIRLKWSEPLDRRFAGFDFSSDNCPRDPENSIALNGCVEFGVRRQPSRSPGRVYRIKVKAAFLDIRNTACRFEPDMALQEQLQKGSLQEKVALATTQGSEIGIGGEGSANIALSKAKAKAGAKVKGGYKNSDKKSIVREYQHETYRVRWIAGGCQFGDSRLGDPLNSEGFLQGVFLNGNWGRLVPDRDALRYGAKFALLVQKGMLSVLVEPKLILSKFFANHETDAFQALKTAVAGWAVESELSSQAAPDGYDGNREELVLAHGYVAVDLTQLKQIEASTQSPNLPDQTLAPETAKKLPAAERISRPREAASKVKKCD